DVINPVVEAVYSESCRIAGHAQVPIRSRFADRSQARAVLSVPRELPVFRGGAEIDQHSILSDGEMRKSGVVRVGRHPFGNREWLARKPEFLDIEWLSEQ